MQTDNRSPSESPIGRTRLLAVSGIGVLCSLVALHVFAQASALKGELHSTGLGLSSEPASTGTSVLEFTILCLLFLSILGISWLGWRWPVIPTSIVAVVVAFRCWEAAWGNYAFWCNFAYSCDDTELRAQSPFTIAGFLALICILLATASLITSLPLLLKGVQPDRQRRVSAMVSALSLPVLGIPICLLLVINSVHESGAMLPTSTPTLVKTTPTPIPETPGPAPLSAPTGITVDRHGVVWVVEPGRNQIIGLGRHGGVVASWVRGGSGPAGLRGPEDIAANSAGTLFVADTLHNRVVAFSEQGRFQGVWARKGHGFSQVWRPLGVASRDSASLFVADTGNHRMEEFRAAHEYDYTTGSGYRSVVDVAEGLDFSTFYALIDGHEVRVGDTIGTRGVHWGAVGSRPGQMRKARGIAVGHTVYVADTGNNRVERFSLRGRLLAVWSSQGWKRPSDVALDRQENVYGTDTGNRRVVKLSPSGRILMIWR